MCRTRVWRLPWSPTLTDDWHAQPPCRRIAACSALSVANRLVADTVSRSSTTWMVADSLWGSTPMNTLDMSFAFPPSSVG
jgi:hypothetical protein